MPEPEVKFGVAGFPPNFFKSDFKNKRENIFQWLNFLGLNWIELQNTYGIKMPDEQAIKYRELASRYKIGISIHAPYYITLASKDKEIVKRSQERIKKAFHLAELINSQRIIFHPGHFPGTSDNDRKAGLDKLIQNLNEIKDDLPTEKIKIYPEISGKVNQLGSLMEIIEICNKVNFARPCLDLAHLHAREGGILKAPEDILNIFDTIEKHLGKKMLKQCHFHMYPVGIDHTGEKGHKAFSDKTKGNQLAFSKDDYYNDDRYYPQVEPFIDAILKRGLNPVVICEAKDTQDEGAILMRDYFIEKKRRGK
ncbi:MAG TPA: TIM barrel protein [Candidatus Paceibacterota bacterium]|nr:TIM barrel protein [Candidatus Paceibacterota bacterium]